MLIKYQKKELLIKYIAMAFLLLWCGVVNASDTSASLKENADGQKFEQSELLKDQIERLSRQINIRSEKDRLLIDEIKQVVNKNESVTNKKIIELEKVVKSQEGIIKRLGLRENTLYKVPIVHGMSFEAWAGILLASVAVLITVLGVGIAILSFIGYRAVLTKAESSAALKAIEVAENEIKNHINKGTFNSTIIEAVQQITYQGIMPDGDEENSDDADS